MTVRQLLQQMRRQKQQRTLARPNETSLTPFNRRSENVVVEAIIVPELKLRNVKMQVFLAHVAPKAFNRLGMDGTDNILMFGMVNGAVREFETDVFIADPLISADQANFVRHGFVDEKPPKSPASRSQ